MSTITVKELIELLNKSLKDGSIENDSEVLCSHFTGMQSGHEHYEFNIEFLWDTVEEHLNA